VSKKFEQINDNLFYKWSLICSTFLESINLLLIDIENIGIAVGISLLIFKLIYKYLRFGSSHIGFSTSGLVG